MVNNPFAGGPRDVANSHTTGNLYYRMFKITNLSDVG
jgi:hypothetical protein